MSEWETAVHAEDGAEEVEQRRLLLFEIAGKVFACDMSAIREIIPFQRVTRLPGAPSTICGLINLRGNIVTVLDLGARVLGKACNREGGSILLVPYRDRLVGIGVDEVRDLQSIRADELTSGEDFTAFDAEIIQGLAEVDGELAVILDIDALVRGVLEQKQGGEL